MDNQATDIKKLLASPEEADRKKGVYLLAQAASKETLFHLQKIAESDESVEIRFFARKAVACVKAALKPKVFDKVPQVKDLASFNWGKASTEEKLGIIQFSINQNLKNNLRFFIDVLQKDPDQQVKSALVVAIGKFGGESEIEVLVPLLDHEVSRIRANTIEALELLGVSKALTHVLTRLDDPDNRVRANAVKIAKNLAPAQILQVVTEMVTSVKPAMQASGAYILQYLPNEKNVALLSPLAQSPHPSVRQNAIATLKKFRQKKIGKAEELWKKLQLDGKGEEKRDTLGGLEKEAGFSLTEAPKNFNGLLAASPEERLKTLQDLSQSGGEKVGRAVLDLLKKEADSKVVAKALLVLGQIRYQEGIPELVRHLADAEVRCRANAVEAISLIGEEKSLRGLIPFLKDANNRVRANAIIALKNTAGVDVGAAVGEMVRSSEELMQRSAVYAIVEIKNPKLYQHLEGLAASGNREVAKTAKNALASLKVEDTGHHDQITLPSLAPSELSSFSSVSETPKPGSEDDFSSLETREVQRLIAHGQAEQAIKKASLMIKDLKGKEGTEAQERTWRRLLADALEARGLLEMKTALAQIPLTLVKAWESQKLAKSDPKKSDQPGCVICDAKFSSGYALVTFKGETHQFCFECTDRLEREGKDRRDKTVMAVRSALESIGLACELDDRKIFPASLAEIAASFGIGQISSAPMRLRLGILDFESSKALLRRREIDMRIAGAMLLGEFGNTGKELVDEIFAVLAEAPGPAKNLILASLRKIGSDILPGKVPPELVDPLLDHEMTLLTDVRPPQRKEALDWLHILAPDWKTHPAVQARIPDLLEAMSQGSVDQKLFLVGFLQKMGGSAEEALPQLTGFIHEWNQTLLEPAKNALHAINPQWALTDIGNNVLSDLVERLPQEPVAGQIDMLTFFAGLDAVGEDLGKKLENLKTILTDETVVGGYEKAVGRVYPAGFARIKSRKWQGFVFSVVGNLVGLVLFALGILFYQFSSGSDKTAGFLLYKTGVLAPEKLVAILTQELSGPAHEKKVEAVAMLGKMGSDAVEGLPNLVNLIFSKDLELREKVGLALPLISMDWQKSPAARKTISSFIPMLLDKDTQIRGSAIENLTKIDRSWNTSAEAKAAVPSILALYPKADPQVIGLIQTLLAKIQTSWENQEEAQRALPLLEKALQSRTARVRRDVVQLLGKMALAQKMAIPLLVESMIDPDDEVRQIAETCLEAYSPEWKNDATVMENLPLLSKKVNSSNPIERTQVMAFLGRVGKGATSILPSMIEELMKAPEDKALSILQVLNKTQANWPSTPEGKTALKTFQARVSNPETDTRIHGLKVGTDTRINGLKMIRELKTGGKDAVSTVVPFLLDPIPDVRFEAAEALKAIDADWAHSEAAKALLPGLKKSLQSTDNTTLLQTLTMLQKLGKACEPLLSEVIVLYATHSHPEVKESSGKLLESALPNWIDSDAATRAIPGLMKAFKTMTPEERQPILEIFEKMGVRAADTAKDLMKILADESSPERLDIIRILGKMGPKANVAIPELKKLINHSSFEIRAEAIATLEKLIPGWKVVDEAGGKGSDLPAPSPAPEPQETAPPPSPEQ